MYIPTMFFQEGELVCNSTDLQPINYTYYSGSIPIVVNYFEAGTSGSFSVYNNITDCTLMVLAQGGYGTEYGAAGAGGLILSSSLDIKDGSVNRPYEKNNGSITLFEGTYTWEVPLSNEYNTGSKGNTSFGSNFPTESIQYYNASKGGRTIFPGQFAPDGGSGAQPNGVSLPLDQSQGNDGGANGGGGASSPGNSAQNPGGGGEGVFHPWFRGTLGEDTFIQFGASDRNQPGGWFAGGGGDGTSNRGVGGGGDKNAPGVAGSGGGAGKWIAPTGMSNPLLGGTGGVWLAYPISQFCPAIENLPTGSSGYRVRFYNDDTNAASPMYVQYQPYGSSSYEGIEVPSRTQFPLDVCIESGSTYYTGSGIYNRVIEVGDCDVYSSSYCECTTVTFTAGVSGGTGSYYPCGEGQLSAFDYEDTITNRLLSGSEVFTTCIISGSVFGITGAGAGLSVGSVCTSSISLCN